MKNDDMLKVRKTSMSKESVNARALTEPSPNAGLQLKLISRTYSYTVERLTDNDNFECADPGLVKKGPSALSKHKTPVGKLIRRQKIDYMTYLYDCESPKLEFLRYHLSFYLRRKFLLCRLRKSCYCTYCSNK